MCAGEMGNDSRQYGQERTPGGYDSKHHVQERCVKGLTKGSMQKRILGSMEVGIMYRREVCRSMALSM